eukprot:gnl/TRDRNA2_/TRDRNA2_183597_c0_seq1.p1 gnl/TRDRNA2_/TRDRNA2_183597_c0~~gnl/TRDRNA2_/TRDRNA2_183597_c0_seq1.p1  ORF type:complete len:382 (+),score=49.09 gnl/TRDRNA2_/TRDRNA2_183597_c0_seq1:115-1260(+)
MAEGEQQHLAVAEGEQQHLAMDDLAKIDEVLAMGDLDKIGSLQRWEALASEAGDLHSLKHHLEEDVKEMIGLSNRASWLAVEGLSGRRLRFPRRATGVGGCVDQRSQRQACAKSKEVQSSPTLPIDIRKSLREQVFQEQKALSRGSTKGTISRSSTKGTFRCSTKSSIRSSATSSSIVSSRSSATSSSIVAPALLSPQQAVTLPAVQRKPAYGGRGNWFVGPGEYSMLGRQPRAEIDASSASSPWLHEPDQWSFFDDSPQEFVQAALQGSLSLPDLPHSYLNSPKAARSNPGSPTRSYTRLTESSRVHMAPQGFSPMAGQCHAASDSTFDFRQGTGVTILRDRSPPPHRDLSPTSCSEPLPSRTEQRIRLRRSSSGAAPWR